MYILFMFNQPYSVGIQTHSVRIKTHYNQLNIIFLSTPIIHNCACKATRTQVSTHTKSVGWPRATTRQQRIRARLCCVIVLVYQSVTLVCLDFLLVKVAGLCWLEPVLVLVINLNALVVMVLVLTAKPWPATTLTTHCLTSLYYPFRSSWRTGAVPFGASNIDFALVLSFSQEQ